MEHFIFRFIKTVQFIIIKVRDICTKMNAYYNTITQKKYYNTFVTKISTGLNPTDILANTSHAVQCGGGNKKHTPAF
jgi:hypothetical protein